MNSSVSVGTESQYSATSPDQFDGSTFQNGGGVFSFLFGSEKGSYATELALRAFNDKAPHVGCYIVKDSLDKSKNASLDYSKQDKHNRSLLHFLVLYSAYSSDAKQLLLDVLEQTNAKNYINLQDNKKNTCTHYAMYTEAEDVVKLLAEYGADLTIRNAEGLYIKLEEVPIKVNPSDIFVKLTSTCNKKNKKGETSSVSTLFSTNKASSVEERLDDIVKKVLKKQHVNTDETDTINFQRDNLSDDTFKAPKSESDNQNTSTVDILNMIMEEFKEGNQNGTQAGGAKKKGKKNTSKQSVTGKRKMVTYSEISVGGGSETDLSDVDSDLNDSDIKKLHEMARAVNNKASDAHATAVLRIKEILGLEDDEARAVKAILYDKVKKEHAELTNLDKAMELEKLASDKSVLKAIKKSDIKKMAEIIKAKHSEKENSSVTEKSSDNDKKKKRRQSRSLPTEDDDSSTSSESAAVKKSKRLLELSDDSSSTSSSSIIMSVMTPI